MSPKSPWILLIGGLLAAAVLGVLTRAVRRRDHGLSRPWPLEPRSHLLSDVERALFQRLVQSLPGHIVLAQVHLLQIMEFRRGRRTQALFNRICQLSVDFLIVNPDTSIRAAIELDDRSHVRRGRPWADARKTHALKSAGIPLIRWKASQLPGPEAIRTAVVQSGAGVAT